MEESKGGCPLDIFDSQFLCADGSQAVVTAIGATMWDPPNGNKECFGNLEDRKINGGMERGKDTYSVL